MTDCTTAQWWSYAFGLLAGGSLAVIGGSVLAVVLVRKGRLR